eukprot:CAMPEP_0202887716 /NCGR_PEP_ID=MMETSP1391-20130828/42825_1 /ASSEMBLY_ACC=CAM_ASM_000867 /TAXON_ID=1034604 /ORGANISM="Chlamydomonas leiostraca, Strain SAG 11-49" /LENGTH=104 /DNA_ID=CAMNT_0049571011 /DNA_START=480 /DNA_END=794 /DNA_ORIENTATION=-
MSLLAPDRSTTNTPTHNSSATSKTPFAGSLFCLLMAGLDLLCAAQPTPTSCVLEAATTQRNPAFPDWMVAALPAVGVTHITSTASTAVISLQPCDAMSTTPTQE